jgi:cell filamentation protein
MKSEQIEFDRKYCYPNSNILINKLNLMDNAKLHVAERNSSTIRLSELSKKPIKGNFDMQHLQKIHKAIFQDIYDWAGKVRTVDISKSNLFCMVQHVSSMAEDIFHKLGSENYLLGYSKEKCVSRLSYYLGEINAMHPFREGNGRSQREFIRCLVAVSGHQLDYKNITEKMMLEASIDSFDLKYDKMETLLRDNMKPLSYEEQLKWCKLIALQKGVFKDCYMKYFGYINTIAADIEASTGFKAQEAIVKKMEYLHQVAEKKVSVKNVHELLQDGSGSKEVMDAAKDVGKELSRHEMQQLEMSEPEP